MYCIYMYWAHFRRHGTTCIHVLMRDENECRGFESHPRQLRKSDCLGCAVLLCLVCLFDLACFFLPSFSSLIKTCTYVQCMYASIHMHLYGSGSTSSHPALRLVSNFLRGGVGTDTVMHLTDCIQSTGSG